MHFISSVNHDSVDATWILLKTFVRSNEKDVYTWRDVILLLYWTDSKTSILSVKFSLFLKNSSEVSTGAAYGIHCKKNFSIYFGAIISSVLSKEEIIDSKLAWTFACRLTVVYNYLVLLPQDISERSIVVHKMTLCNFYPCWDTFYCLSVWGRILFLIST